MTDRKFYKFVFCLMMIFLCFVSSGCGGGSSSLSDNSQIVEPEPEPEPSGYTVIFDSDGGTEIASQNVEAGSLVTRPDDPEKENNSFMGWYTSKGFSFRFDFNTPISSNITLYAKWWDNNDTTDSDNDGLPDSLEITYGTDPFNVDTDDDGLTDWDELNWLGYNPLAKDTDGNGILDGDEDPDDDGLTNIQEANYGTNMTAKDTDHDDLNDYDEVITYKTDPLNPDTDGDGVEDGLEVALGTDPLTPETSFTTELEFDYTSANPGAANISVSMKSKAEAAGTLSIMPANYSDSPFISRYIPGYIAAYNINADASFDIAEITFTLGSEAGTINKDFQPVIYYLDESTGILRKLSN
ncbi:MAG: InlB B-repeat-containing protein [Synergistaceae bacterium]|nr:InlB B-repeat-containing protein [Synergistaceae bacterium]